MNRLPYKKLLLLILVFLFLPFPGRPAAAVSNADEFLLECRYKCPSPLDRYISHLTDHDPYTTVTLNRKETLELILPDNAPLAGLYFDFYESPSSLDIVLLDESRNVLASKTASDPSFLYQYAVQDLPVKYIDLSSAKSKVVFSELYAYTEGFTPPFSSATEPADLLVVMNEPGDELMLFGGLLAILSREHQLSTQVVYLTKADGFHTHQCMDVLQSLGVRRKPYFWKGTLSSVNKAQQVYEALGGEKVVRNRLVNLIRTIQPKIVLSIGYTKDKSRYSDAMVTKLAQSAVQSAADPNISLGKTSPYKVPKAYVLRSSGETVIDLDVPLFTLNGESAGVFAQSLYSTYTEEQVYKRILPTNLRLHLFSSAIGADQEKNDLLEHLDPGSFISYTVPTATPAPTPEPSHTPEPVPEQTPTSVPAATTAPKPSPEPSPKSEERDVPKVFDLRLFALRWLPLLIGVILAGCLWYLFQNLLSRPGYLWICVLPFVIGLLFTVFSPFRTDPKATPPPAIAETDAPAFSAVPASTPELTPEPTPEPTPDPTSEPTPEPTQEPNKQAFEQYFLNHSGEEYELDFKQGHWWYKSDTLGIDISRVKTTYKDTRKPLVYYVADIYMKDGSSYRSGIRSYTQPFKFARYEKAVLAITGDNLTYAEKEIKGCLIRKGVLYANYGRSDTLIIEPDKRTLSVARASEFTSRELLDRGVRDTYGFGPILIRDGEIRSNLKKHRLSYPNPRCGIGMVESGHWIAIVTDGRQPGYSVSISLEYFATLFADRNCSVAYNLDGGSSTGMVFMGEALNQHSRNDGQRPWPDCLMFGYSNNIPSPDEPTKYRGYHYGK